MKQGFDRQELGILLKQFRFEHIKIMGKGRQEAAVWEWIKDSTISGTLGYCLWLSLPL